MSQNDYTDGWILSFGIPGSSFDFAQAYNSTQDKYRPELNIIIQPQVCNFFFAG